MNKILSSFVMMLALISPSVLAQQSAAERAERMRAQMVDIQAQQIDLQTRLAQLDEEIKPQNIERSLAGVGSVHPEELREARRRQLEIQRRGIQSQLDSLAETLRRLESAVAAADAERYRQMVGPNPTSVSNINTSKQVSHEHRQKHRVKPRHAKRERDLKP